MTHRFISQLTDREAVNDVFVAADKQLRTNRHGNLYLQMRLSDRTGTVNAMMWNANEKVYHAFDNGDYVQVQGTAQFYNGALQIIVSGVETVPATEVDESDYVRLGTRQVDRMAQRLAELLREINSVPLRDLAECFLMDEQLMAEFTTAPAGIKAHHAYRGGLLEHVVGLMEVCSAVAPFYPELDRDALLMGAFLHDIGKLRELTYDRDLSYSDEGQLIGHLIIGVDMLDRKVRETEKLSGEPFPEQLLLRLKHMIVSHHGEYEFGSPKLPMTLEAIALHFLDNLDSKMHSIGQLIREDANVDSNWTPYQAMLGRKLFKVSPTPETP
jgi:3'-5' exoribonuclease